MRITRTRGILAVVTIAAIGVGAWLLRPTPLPVDAAVVTRGPLRMTIDEQGVTRFRRHTEVRAPVSGRLGESRLRVGDSVTAGGVVAELWPAPLDVRQQEEARAAAAAARALRGEADARVTQARVALAEATRARRRAEQLAGAGAIAQRDLERATDDEVLRQRDLTAASARAVAAAEEERRASLALVSASPQSPANSARMPLRAPMSGRILRIFEEHDRVVPPGTPLVEIGDASSIELVVDVLTRDAGAIRSGAPMSVAVADAPPLRARVERVEPAGFTKLSPLGVEEQRVNVIGQLLDSPAALGDHFEVEASIVVWEAPSVTRIPITALVPVGSGWGVFRVTSGRARLLRVTVGHRSAAVAEVLDGVAAGDTVVLHPDERIADRVRVTPRGS